MSRLGYILRCIVKMDYSNLIKTVNRSHKKSGKGRISLFVDIVKCGFKYGAGYMDYELLEWWNLNEKQRATYVTRGINNSMIKICNKSECYHLLHNKDEFNELFSDMLGRKWIRVDKASFEDFERFMTGLDTVLIKPLDSNCGKGVEKLSRKDYKDIRELYDYIIGTGCALAEEYIVQHSEMSRMYPESVNTVRVVTVLDKEGEPHIIYAAVRLGNEGRVVDNINAGGLSAPVDKETGVLTNVAFDKNFHYYDEHPYTGVKIVGFRIPLWSEVVDLVTVAAKRIPELRYVGWDVAITEKGPLFVEANHHPGHDIIQMPRHTPDKIGMLPEFRKYIDI